MPRNTELSYGDYWAKYRRHLGHGSLGTLSSVSMYFPLHRIPWVTAKADTGFVGPETDAYKTRYKVKVNIG